MLEEVGSYDAKTKLPEILRRVEAGESFTITKRGRPIADLIPSRSSSQVRCKAAIANIRKAKKHEVSDADFKEMMESGRK